jgi:hypothetical protein
MLPISCQVLPIAGKTRLGSPRPNLLRSTGSRYPVLHVRPGTGPAVCQSHGLLGHYPRHGLAQRRQPELRYSNHRWISRAFQPAEVARAQFPGRPSFQGWIALDPKASMAANELFFMSVHELGHVFGLPHSNNASSVMYFLLLDVRRSSMMPISRDWRLVTSSA